MSIDNELAKELKDAGWRSLQDIPDEYLYLNSPDLSELMEACGNEFISLVRVDEHTWEAGYGLLVNGAPHYNLQVTSSTPEEAVARLWLALNRKK